MYDITKLLKEEDVKVLLSILPAPRQRKEGRPRVPKDALLKGIIQVLVLGIGWNKIFDCDCSYSSCYRYFQERQRRDHPHLVFDVLAKKTNLAEGTIDSDTVTSLRFRNLTGWDGKHRKVGTKVSLFTDLKGLPADIEFGKGSTHDSRFIPKHLRKPPVTEGKMS